MLGGDVEEYASLRVAPSLFMSALPDTRGPWPDGLPEYRYCDETHWRGTQQQPLMEKWLTELQFLEHVDKLADEHLRPAGVGLGIYVYAFMRMPASFCAFCAFGLWGLLRCFMGMVGVYSAPSFCLPCYFRLCLLFNRRFPGNAVQLCSHQQSRPARCSSHHWFACSPQPPPIT